MKIFDGNPTTVGSFILGEITPREGSFDYQSLYYLNVEQQTGRVLVVGLYLQVMHAVPSTLVLFILRAVT